VFTPYSRYHNTHFSASHITRFQQISLRHLWWWDNNNKYNIIYCHHNNIILIHVPVFKQTQFTQQHTEEEGPQRKHAKQDWMDHGPTPTSTWTLVTIEGPSTSTCVHIAEKFRCRWADDELFEDILFANIFEHLVKFSNLFCNRSAAAARRA